MAIAASTFYTGIVYVHLKEQYVFNENLVAFQEFTSKLIQFLGVIELVNPAYQHRSIESVDLV